MAAGFVLAGGGSEASGQIYTLERDENGASFLLSGEITPELARNAIFAVETVKAAVAAPVQIDFYLSSPGGDVKSAFAIGEVLRKHNALTAVREGDSCASACVYILAAGALRSVLGTVKIHRPYFGNAARFGAQPIEVARLQYQALAMELRSYLARMGMPDALFNAMMHVPSSGSRKLSDTELTDFGLSGEDPAYAEWLRARAR